MTTDETIDKVLDVEALKRLPSSPVVDVRWRPAVEWDGAEALEIVVALDNSQTDKDLKWERVQPIHRAIFDGLRAAGISRFPIIRWVKQADLADLGIDF